MKAVIQRVKKAELSVGGQTVSAIGSGLAIYLGVQKGDGFACADAFARKVSHLRIFSDEQGKMNYSAADVNAEILLISQVTLLAELSKGNRPSFSEAEEPDKANELYTYTAQKLRDCNLKVSTGVFGADMEIAQLNDGPVTVIWEDKK